MNEVSVGVSGRKVEITKLEVNPLRPGKVHKHSLCMCMSLVQRNQNLAAVVGPRAKYQNYGAISRQ